MRSTGWIIWPGQERSADLAAWLQRNPVTAGGALGLAAILAGVFTLGTMNSASPRIETANAKTVETTGSTPRTGWDEAKRAKCREQIWPYISRSCVIRPDGSTRNVRVISTDSMNAPAAAAIAAERAPTTRQPASPVVVTGRVPAVHARDDSFRRRGTEQYTAGRFIGMREYDVPSHDRSGRRQEHGDRYGSNGYFFRF